MFRITICIQKKKPDQVKKVFNLPNTSSLSPICYNYAFLPSQVDAVFLIWRLATVDDLYTNNVSGICKSRTMSEEIFQTWKLIILMMNLSPDWQHLRTSWESDMGVDVSEGVWANCLLSIHSRHQLIQCKVIHRLLYSFYTSLSLLCIKCKQSNGTLAHMSGSAADSTCSGQKFFITTQMFMRTIFLPIQKQPF